MTFARKNNVIALVCMCLYIYPIFENQPNDICGHLSEEASKGRFLKPDKLQNHSNEGKGRKRKSDGKVKEEKRNKAMAAFFVFIIATLELVFGKKKIKKTGEKRMFDAKGPFGHKVFKNPARYVFLTFLYCPSQIMQ